MTDLNKDYELEYWDAHKEEDYLDCFVMMSMLSKMMVILEGSAVDVGCGPRGGVFRAVSFGEMYGVDPLWSSYLANGLDKAPCQVERVDADAQSFTLPEKVDFAFSFNALDHSGDIEASINNILSWVKPGGRFLFHVHMRTPEQLNAGHKMVLSEEILDGILSGRRVERREILDKCPFSEKPYKSYVAEVIA